MTLKERLVLIGTAYAAARKLSLSRVSTIVFQDGKVLDRISGDGDITTSRYERAMEWFSANWPAGHAWPADIERPAAKAEAAE